MKHRVDFVALLSRSARTFVVAASGLFLAWNNYAHMVDPGWRLAGLVAVLPLMAIGFKWAEQPHDPNRETE